MTGERPVTVKPFVIERVARPGAAVPKLFNRWVPEHVWTLHVVPGLLDGPLLAVKRRVLDDDGLAGDALLKFEIGRHNASVWGGDLGARDAAGRARASGSGEILDDTAEYYLEACELGPWVYDHLPSEAEARAWLKLHRAEQELLRAGPSHVFVCFPGALPGAPDRAVRCETDRDMQRVANGARYAWSIRLPGVKDTLHSMNLLELAFKPCLWSGWKGHDVRVYLNKPSAEELAEAGAQRAKKETAKARAEREGDEAFWGAWHSGNWAGGGAASGAAPKPTGVQALEALGLSTTCTAADVRAAFRRMAKEGHPDKGGAMDMGKLVELRDLALAYVEECA